MYLGNSSVPKADTASACYSMMPPSGLGTAQVLRRRELLTKFRSGGTYRKDI